MPDFLPYRFSLISIEDDGLLLHLDIAVGMEQESVTTGLYRLTTLLSAISETGIDVALFGGDSEKAPIRIHFAREPDIEVIALAVNNLIASGHLLPTSTCNRPQFLTMLINTDTFPSVSNENFLY
jgi:hypothetical protein